MRTIVNSSKTFRDEDKLESSIEIVNTNYDSDPELEILNLKS